MISRAILLCIDVVKYESLGSTGEVLVNVDIVDTFTTFVIVKFYPYTIFSLL